MWDLTLKRGAMHYREVFILCGLLYLYTLVVSVDFVFSLCKKDEYSLLLLSYSYFSMTDHLVAQLVSLLYTVKNLSF